MEPPDTHKEKTEMAVDGPGPHSAPASTALSVASPDPGVPDRCWNGIGVYGDARCSALQTHGHCRNCPVFSEAGLKLLDAPVPENYREEWSRHFASQKQAFETSDGSALVFRIRQEWFALPARVFQEVTETRRIHSLPHRRRGIVLGLANVRGELVVCISLGHVLRMGGLPPPDQLRASYERLLVADWQGNRFGFPVDEVPGTRRLRLQDLKPPPSTVSLSARTFTQGVFYWANCAVGLLNPDLLFSSLNESLK